MPTDLNETVALLVGDAAVVFPELDGTSGKHGVHGYRLEYCDGPDRALDRLVSGDIGVLVVGVDGEDASTMALLEQVARDWPELAVVIVATKSPSAIVLTDIHKKAQFLMSGPITSPDLLICAIQSAVERKRAESELLAKLDAEHKQRTFYEALFTVGAKLASTLDYQEVLDLILDQMGLVIPHDVADICVIEGQRLRTLRWRGYDRFGAAEYIESVGLEFAMVQNYVTMKMTGRPVAIPRVDEYADWVMCDDVAFIKSYIGAPIIVDEEVIGFLNVSSQVSGFFADEDAQRLLGFADRAAQAIRNARLYETSLVELAERKRAEVALQQRLVVEELIATASTRFVQLDLGSFDQALDDTLGSIAEFVAADLGFLMEFEEVTWRESNRVFRWAAPGIQYPESQQVADPHILVPWAVEALDTGLPVKINRLSDLPPNAGAELVMLRRAKIQSLLVVPFQHAEQLKGILGMAMVRLERRWTDEDANLLRSMGEVLFIALSRQRAEEALRNNERKYRDLAFENARLLDQANRDAETKSTLLKEVNHRVKNNLTGIIGLLYAEQMRGACGENRGNILEEMTCRIQSMATVHSMLTASEWGPVALDEVTERVIHATQRIVSQHRRASISVTPCSVAVTPDEAHSLSLVVNELTTNSFKACPENGVPMQIHVDIRAEGTGIHLTYRDNGPGYPKEVLESGAGSVGLYLVRNIVRRELGGTVSFSSEGGAVTDITFPSETWRPPAAA